MYGDNMPKIITKVHFERLMSYVNENNLIYGGQNEPASNTIHPTLIRANGFEDKSMQEEIFGPILPIITYKKIDEILPIIANRPKPLALYIFSNDNKFVDKCLNTINSGGVCINDTIMHITNHHLPFGGIEESGVGNYHGKYSYHTFTHARAVLKTSTKVDSKLFYPP
jgi:aldehyde dehydrogenase (NAD+)